jgi:hypothetical protein
MRVLPLGLLRRAVAKYVNRAYKPRVTGWAIRTVLVLLAVSFRGGLDSFTIVAWILAIGGFALGFVLENRPKKQEDLTSVIFPGEQ